MKQSDVLRLRGDHWFAPFPDQHPEFEVCIRPERGSVILNSSMLPGEAKTVQVCRELFTNFRGYTNGDGGDVKNTLESRKELYDVLTIQAAIENKVYELHRQVLEGEDSAASD